MTEDLYSLQRLRRGLGAFVLGKAASVLLTVLSLLLLARGLSIADFGAYGAIAAAAEVALVVSAFGLDWVSAQIVPEFAANGGARAVTRLIALVGVLRLASLIAAAGLIALLAGPIADAAGIVYWQNLLRLYAWVVLLEGMSRHLRHCVFEPLLQQEQSQLNTVVRNVVFLFGLAILRLTHGGALDLDAVIEIEIAASALALVYGAWRVSNGALPRSGEPRADWTPPPVRKITSLALNNFASTFIHSLAGANVLTLVGAAMLGPALIAPYALARTLTEQLRRNLPADLLIGLIRPRTVADYTANGDMGRVLLQLGTLYKSGLFLLAPLGVVALAFGPGWLVLLFGPGYRLAYVPLLILIAALVPLSHRVIVSTVANLLHRADVVMRATVFALIALPAAVTLLWLGAGAAGLAFGALVNEVAYNGYVVWSLRRGGCPYSVDWPRIARLTAALLLAALIAYPLARVTEGAVALTFASLGAVAVFLLLAAWLKPFSDAERTHLREISGMEFFPW
ncbi:MAG TPA: oligosaccharide flippase family protein [Candidatus Cybelea sp.]|nr:oligosaccharide flippase family protein [Candidatus Cybelea sp.]